MTLSHTWARISNDICGHQQATVPTHTQYHYSIPLLTHCSTRLSHMSCVEAVPATQHHGQVMYVTKASDSSPKPSYYPYAWLTWTVMTLSLERQSRTPLDNPSLPETCNKMVGSQKLVVGAILLTVTSLAQGGEKTTIIIKDFIKHHATKTHGEVQVELALNGGEWWASCSKCTQWIGGGGRPSRDCIDIVVNRKVTAPSRDQTSDVHHVAYSLHWLSYSCPTIAEASSIFTWFLDDL